MARFLDGPVAGSELLLRRAPLFLRVTVDETDGRVDALDRLDDTPGPSEQLHVYRRGPESFGAMFLCGRGRAPGGRFEYGDYRYVGVVADDQVRETMAWRSWCTERAAAEGIEIPPWPPAQAAA